jgi:hypothetical protein
MRLIARAAALLPTLAICLTLAPSAKAGTYQLFTCKLPDGTPVGTDGWEADAAGTGWSLTNRCSSGGGLDAQMENIGITAGPSLAWRWTLPAPLRLTTLDVDRAVLLTASDSPATPFVRILSGSTQLDGFQGPASVGDMVDWDAALNAVHVGDETRLGTNSVTAAVGCTGPKGSVCPANGGSPNTLRVHAATFTISDDFAPTVSNVSGSLTSSTVKSGLENLVFSASDAGGGVYRAIVAIDGVVIAEPVVSNLTGTCVDVYTAHGDTDPHQFGARKPCPSSVEGVQLPLDTRTLSDGDHLLTISVDDAAGNRTPVYGPATMTVRNAAQTGTDNPPAGTGNPPGGGSGSSTPPAGTPNGTNATTNARLDIISVPRTVRLKYGRTTTLRGRLTTPSGTGIAGAAIDVAARTSLPGKSWATVATIHTDASGAFSYRVPVGPSRTLRLTYRARTGDAQPVESDDVVLRVISRVDLRLSRKHLRNGQTLRYRGRIHGAYAKGRLAEVQVRVQDRWRVVCVTRARSAGRFGCSYRFRRTFVPARYTFRAVVRQQAGFPYEPGTSPTRHVRVSPH